MTPSEADALATFLPDRPVSVATCELLDGLRETSRVLSGASWIEREQQRYLCVTGEAPLTDLEALNAYTVKLVEQGEFTNAHTFASLALRLSLAWLPDDHSTSLISLSNVASCLDEMGQSSAALPLLEYASEVCRTVYGEAAPNTLLALNNLASCHQRLDAPQRALEIQQRVLDGQRVALGEDHVNTLISMNNVASCHNALNAPERALPLFEQALEKLRTRLGDEHALTLRSLNGVANSYMLMRDPQRALPLREQALKIRRAVLGDKHPDTLLSISNLAQCYAVLGESRRALPLLEAAATGHLTVLGDRHPETLASLTALVSCHEMLGNSREAYEWHERLVTASRALLGETHPITLERLSRLATHHCRVGRMTDAVQLAEQVLNQQRATLGEDHADTLATAGNLATFYIGTGALLRAQRLLEQHLEKLQAHHGDSHPTTLTCLGNLANCYDQLGESRRSLPLFERIFQQEQATRGALNPRTLVSLNSLAYCHMRLGDLRRAKSLFEQAIEGQRAVLGNEHQETMLSLHNLALCHLQMNDAHGALPLLQTALSHYDVALGEDHPHTQLVRRNLGYCYNSLGEPERAKALLEQALARASAVLGEHHPTTLMCLHELPQACREMGDTLAAQTYARQFLQAVANTELRDGHWPQFTLDAIFLVASLASEENRLELGTPLGRISRTFAEELDLADADAKTRLEEPFRDFHAQWLVLVIQHWPTEVPAVLAAIQGREMGALLLDELLAGDVAFPEGDPRREYLSVRQELRRLRLQLSSQTASGKTAHEQTSDRAAIRWRELVAAHEQAYMRYRACRRTLAETFPEFKLAGLLLYFDVSTMLDRLQSDEAIVMFFTINNGREGGYRGCAVCALRRDHERGGISAVSGVLGSTPEALQTLRRYEHTLDRNARGALRRLRTDSRAPATAATPPVTLPELFEIFREVLWAPLDELTGVRKLHVIMHGLFHNLPITASAPAGKEVFLYPGLLFYLQRHHLPDPRPGRAHVPSLDATAPWMAVHTDAASGTNSHIPFVAVDAALVRSIVGSRHVHQPEPANTVKLWEDPRAQSYPAWYFASHGGVHPGPPRQTFLYLDTANHQLLDTSRVLASAQRPRVLVLGCCLVARMHEDEDGNPLGLLSAFFLRGADYIVAAIQSVHDFYMPLLVGLFYQAWLELRDPHAALIEAKRRLKTGDWYPDSAAHLQAAYLPVLCEVLETASATPAAAYSIGGWLLPQEVRNRYPGAFDVRRNESSWREFERDHCQTPASRREFSLAVLAHLIDQRGALPAEYIEHLCAWVCGFGCGREQP